MKKLIKGLKFEFFAIYLYICSFNEIFIQSKNGHLKKTIFINEDTGTAYFTISATRNTKQDPKR